MTGRAQQVAEAGPRPLPRPADLESLPRLMRLVRQVPGHMRRFAVTPAEARSRHQIGPDLADLLVAEGLPYVGEGQDRLYDDYDLGNLALYLGLPTVRRMTLRSWAANLRNNASRPESRLRVSVVPQCPAGPHRGPCTYHLLQPGGGRAEVRADAAGASVGQYDVRLAGQWPELPSAARELAAESAGLEFFILPEAIRWDLDFISRTGVADCGSIAAWLVRESERRGVPARFSFGLLVAKPYSTPHCWVEFLADGVWVPYDPLLLDALRRWTRLDQDAWPRDRSIGPVLYRLSGRFTKVASHEGVWAPLSLPTDYEVTNPSGASPPGP